MDTVGLGGLIASVGYFYMVHAGTIAEIFIAG